MKNKSKKLLSTLLAVMMVFGLFAAMPITASAADPVCAIGSVQYENLADALAAVPEGGASPTVIKLLADITHDEHAFILNKKITIDLNDKNLIFIGYLFFNNGSHFDYTGSGKLEVNRTFTDDRDEIEEFYPLSVHGGSTCRLTGVSVVDNGSGRHTLYGVNCTNGSTLTVDGNVSAKSNGDIGSTSTGIWAYHAGTTVTVNGTITADTTYIRVELTDKSEEDKTTPTTKAGYFTYTDGKSVVWVKEPGAMSNFTKSKTYTPGMFADVDENQWYGYTQQKVIANAYEYGLMQGSGSTFNPTGNMTIAEAVTIAARVHHIYNGGDGIFTQGSVWYQVYVDYAIANNIIAANDFTNYKKAATRAEMSYIFSNALPAAEFASQNTVNALPDVNSSTPYYSAILMLYKAGVVAGSDSIGTFNPANNITRAEAAAIISRVMLPTERFGGKTFG
jgi:S-layer homology domain.